jgi:hypothetical protein
MTRETDPVRHTTLLNCCAFQRAAERAAVNACLSLSIGSLRVAETFQLQAQDHHKQMRIRLERLLGP